MNLRDARQNAKLTLEEAGARFKVSASTVHQWESGKVMPRVTRIPLIAAVYDISISEALLATQESAKRE